MAIENLTTIEILALVQCWHDGHDHCPDRLIALANELKAARAREQSAKTLRAA